MYVKNILIDLGSAAFANNNNSEQKGTLLFMSAHIHKCLAARYLDDLISLLYSILNLLSRCLPWEAYTTGTRIDHEKLAREKELFHTKVVVNLIIV